MAVIKTLGPTSLVRRCNRHGCQKMVHGFLRMNIPAADDPQHKHPPLQLPVPLLLCDEHMKEANARDFQTESWRQEMRTALRNRGAKVDPDFKNAWLDIVPFEQGNEVSEGEPHGTV